MAKRRTMTLRVGDFAKLLFVPDRPLLGGRGPSGERMWVQVTSIRGRRCVGRLDSKPLFLRGIKYRDVVSFDASAVLDVWAR